MRNTSACSPASDVPDVAGVSGAQRWAAVGAGLVALSILWPVTLAAATGARAGGEMPLWSAAVYLAASRLCHQRPERSFHTADTAWPVCARCSGLYLSAPIGAVAAWSRRRRSSTAERKWRRGLALGALPTIGTLLVEWAGLAPVTNVMRAMAAVPLGLLVAWALIDVLPVDRPNQVH